MRARSRVTWLVYAACALLLVDTLGWATWQGLRLEQRERTARAQSEREQAMRLALWRMESVVTPLLARESARPYFHYWPTYAAEQPYATAWRIGPDSIVATSPLLDEPADAGTYWLRLHYQIDPTGRVQIPAAAGDPTRPATARAVRAAGELRRFISRPAEQLPAVPPAQTAEGASQPADSEAQQDLYLQSREDGLAARQLNVRRAQKATVPGAASVMTITPEGALSDTLGQPPQLLVENAAGAVGVGIGPFEPRWVMDAGGPQLVYERSVVIEDATYTQGLWIDWPGLRSELLAEAIGVLPEAELTPLAAGEALSPDTLASVPARLAVTWPTAAGGDGMTPLRLALVVSWIAVITGLVAIWLVLRAAIRLSERRARFVSAVTHEMRTPLTAFRLHADLLASGRLADEDARARTITTVKHEAERLSDVVESVLAAARLDQGQEPKRGSTPIADLDRVLKPRLAEIAERAGATLNWAVDADAGTVLGIALPELERIMVNLVDNACKHGLPRPDSGGAGEPAVRIGVVTERGAGGGLCRITVADNGPGVADEDRGRVFQEFERGRDSGGVGGMGLGLALARRLAQVAGGELALLERRGPGAVFELRVPVVRG